jgi:hypothetical protein
MARKIRLSVIAAAMFLGASVSGPVSAAAAEQSQQVGRQKVWTNDDIQLLRGITPNFSPSLREAGDTSRAGSAPAKYVRFKDPRWYREQLQPLRIELDRINSALRRLRAALTSAKGGTNAINFDRDTEGITPESEVRLLQQRRRDILSRMDAIEDLAQRNEIPPGELRKARSPGELAMDAYKEDAANAPLDADPPQTEAQWRKEFAELREQLYYAQKELDVLQREWNVSLVQHYPNPNKALHEQFSRREINKLARKIREKKAEVAQIEQNISDLEDDLRHAGGFSGWARD